MTKLNSAKKVVLKGRGSLTLRPTDHMATGGEGSIYRAKRTIVKLYTDQKKMMRDRMPDKLGQLATFDHPFIVSPKGLVTTEKGSPIGFYMPYVSGEPLPRVFTNSFWKREGFSNKDASKFVHGMRETIEYAHQKQALLVDANELNWIAHRDKVGFEPRVIDVDSWALGNWPAQVVMPSIRDPHTSSFSELTDWYAWAIVTFQVYAGIHPYKGSLDGFKRHDMLSRMKANASVFRKGIKLNRAVRDFADIPGQLLDWYQAVFEQEERSVPPSPFATGMGHARPARTLRMVTTAQGALVYKKIFENILDPVVRIHVVGLGELRSGALVDLYTGRAIGTVQTKESEIVSTDRGWLVGEVVNDVLNVVHLDRTSHERTDCHITLPAQRVVQGAGRLFAITDRGLTEITFRMLGKKPIVTIGSVWGIMPHATSWFDGFGVTDVLGAQHLVLPFGERGVHTVRVKELDNVHVLAGAGEGRITIVLGLTSAGQYVRYSFVFEANMSQYNVTDTVQDSAELNVVVLPKGVMAHIEEDGELVVSVPVSGVINKVADRDIATDLHLTRHDNQVLFLKSGAVWSLRMQ